MQFWLVRHGESESNIGLPDPSREGARLTARGQEQVRAVVDVLPEPDLIIASPFVRAQESAEPLRQHYPDAENATWQVQEFCPLADEYYTAVPMAIRLPRFRAFFERDDAAYRCAPNTETFNDGLQRVQTMFDQLRASKHERIVVFTHGTFLRMTLWLHNFGNLGRGMAAFGAFQKTFSLPNCAYLHGHISDDVIYLRGIVTDHLS